VDRNFLTICDENITADVMHTHTTFSALRTEFLSAMP